MTTEAMTTEMVEGTLPPHAVALAAVWETVLTNYAAAHAISTSEALAAGLAFFGGMLVQAALGNEWTREKEAAVRAWATVSLAQLPFASERDKGPMSEESANADR